MRAHRRPARTVSPSHRRSRPRPVARQVGGRSRAREGFALVEVIVAMVILTVGMLGLAQLATLALGGTRLAGRSVELMALAENSLARVQGSSYDDLTLGVQTDTVQVWGLDYARSLTTTQVGQRTREVRVDVVPLSAGSPISLVTYVVK